MIPLLSPPTVMPRQLDALWKELGQYLVLPETLPEPQEEQAQTSVLLDLEEPVLLSLQRLLGADNVNTEGNVRRKYAGGATYPGYIRRQTHKPTPLAIVYPQNEQAIAGLMLWANQREIKLLPWGYGTDPYYGKTPVVEPFLIVAPSQPQRVLEINPARRQVRVQAGCAWHDVEVALNAQGLTSGQSLATSETTIGGSVATNSFNLRNLQYGALTDTVRQIRAITPSGPLHLEQPTPGIPDERHFMLGSFGAAGIITEVTLKVFARHAEKLWMIASFTSWSQGIEALAQIAQHPLRPVSAQMVNAKELHLFNMNAASKIRQLLRSVRGNAEEWETHLILELEGEREMLNATRRSLEEFFKRMDIQSETNEKDNLLTDTGSGLRRQLLQQLWERGILAHHITATAPWHLMPDFLRDWDESLSSILQATGGGPGLPLTRIYAMEDQAYIYTLLLGAQAAGDSGARAAQLENIYAVAQETKRRWDIDPRATTLITRAIHAATTALDPLEIMVR